METNTQTQQHIDAAAFLAWCGERGATAYDIWTHCPSFQQAGMDTADAARVLRDLGAIRVR